VRAAPPPGLLTSGRTRDTRRVITANSAFTFFVAAASRRLFTPAEVGRGWRAGPTRVGSRQVKPSPAQV
jgi:hypothetical protein